MPEDRRTRAPNPSRDDIMTLDDIAAELGLGRDAARKLVSKGVLPRLPHMYWVRVPRAAFEAYIRGETNGTAK
jgi:hypothetical protein